MIEFVPGLSGTITLASELDVWADCNVVKITGPGPESLTIDANHSSRIFTVHKASIISGMTLTGGIGTTSLGDPEEYLPAGGGAIAGRASIELRDIVITGNTAIGYGGAVLGDVVLIDSTIRGNSASQDGGGISGSTTSTNSVIVGNTASGCGGGLYGSVDLRETTVANNSAERSGGGICGSFSQGKSSLDRSTVHGNVTSGSGGGIDPNATTLSITNSTLSGNSAAGDGGGLDHPGSYIGEFVTFSSLTISNSTVSGNVAGGNGGGINTQDIELLYSTVFGNTAGETGGGVRATGKGTVRHAVLAANTATNAPDLSIENAQNAPAIEFTLVGDNQGNQLGESSSGDSKGNIVGSKAGGGVVDPRLAALAYNGGPTKTHLPLFDSPVINAGDPAISSRSRPHDQRGLGFDGVVDGFVDLGSVEAINPFPYRWHNQIRPADVDDDGQIGPLDALLIITELTQRRYSSMHNGRLIPMEFPPIYLDVDRDDVVGPLDALRVIGQLPSSIGSTPVSVIQVSAALGQHESDEYEREKVIDAVFAQSPEAAI